MLIPKKSYTNIITKCLNRELKKTKILIIFLISIKEYYLFSEEIKVKFIV